MIHEAYLLLLTQIDSFLNTKCLFLSWNTAMLSKQLIYFLLPFSCDCAILFFDSLFAVSVRPHYKVLYCMAKCLHSGWGFCSFSALVCQQGSEIYKWLNQISTTSWKTCCSTGNLNTELFSLLIIIFVIHIIASNIATSFLDPRLHFHSS